MQQAQNFDPTFILLLCAACTMPAEFDRVKSLIGIQSR